MKEISEIKAKVYSQKLAENLKLQKINKIKDRLEIKEINHLQKAEKLEKILSNKSKEKFGKTKSSHGNIPTNNQDIPINNKNCDQSYEDDGSFRRMRNNSKIKSGVKEGNNSNNNSKNKFHQKKDLILNIVDPENNSKGFRNSNLNSPSDFNNVGNSNYNNENSNLNNFSGYINGN